MRPPRTSVDSDPATQSARQPDRTGRSNIDGYAPHHDLPVSSISAIIHVLLRLPYNVPSSTGGERQWARLLESQNTNRKVSMAVANFPVVSP